MVVFCSSHFSSSVILGSFSVHLIFHVVSFLQQLLMGWMLGKVQIGAVIFFVE